MVDAKTQLVIPEVVKPAQFDREHLAAMMLLIVRLGGRLVLPVVERLSEEQVRDLDGNFAKHGIRVSRMWHASLEDGGMGDTNRLLFTRAA